MSRGAEEQRGDSRERVPGGQNEFAVGNVVAEPAAQVGGASVKNIVKSVERDGEAGGTGEAVSRSEHARGVKDQEGMREIAGAENADAQQKAAKGNGKGGAPRKMFASIVTRWDARGQETRKRLRPRGPARVSRGKLFCRSGRSAGATKGQ